MISGNNQNLLDIKKFNCLFIIRKKNIKKKTELECTKIYSNQQLSAV